MKQFAWIVLAGFLLTQSFRSEAEEPATEISMVKGTPAGEIYLNDRLVTEPELDQELTRLQQVGGSIWYDRENPEKEPTPAQWAVSQKLADAELPMYLLNPE